MNSTLHLYTTQQNVWHYKNKWLLTFDHIIEFQLYDSSLVRLHYMHFTETHFIHQSWSTCWMLDVSYLYLVQEG